ncbi:MAG: hypothetical protein JJE39_05580 [Vicinamibacteria bacterium]|nr:hypothetical protein [Vicinamibacteria bacterium]
MSAHEHQVTPALVSPAPDVPVPVTSLRRIAGFVALVASAVVLTGYSNPRQLLQSYLPAFLLWTGVSIGCLSMLMIQHQSGGHWGILLRRLLEAGARTIYFMPIFFIPILLGMADLYPWADPVRIAADQHLAEVVQKKGAYLNVPFFIGRAIFYFLFWALMARTLTAFSWKYDETGDREYAEKMRRMSGWGLLAQALVITFAGVDWGMSLDPHWYSTIWGILFMVGQALSAWCLCIMVVSRLYTHAPLNRVASSTLFHDLGKFLFALVMLWGYVNLSQFLIIWSGNLPEETTWYLDRSVGAWKQLTYLVVGLHFFLPFFTLLSAGLKKNAGRLAVVAGSLFALRYVDLFWNIAPIFKHQHFSVHPFDLLMPVALGGAWLYLFARQIERASLLVKHDPQVHEMEVLAAHAH